MYFSGTRRLAKPSFSLQTNEGVGGSAADPVLSLCRYSAFSTFVCRHMILCII